MDDVAWGDDAATWADPDVGWGGIPAGNTVAVSIGLLGDVSVSEEPLL